MVKITSANDIEIVIDRNGTSSSTSGDSSMGRLVVDEFSISREQGNEHVGSVGDGTPVGYSEGVSMHSFSWTMMGDDVTTFRIVTGDDGTSNEFSFTARKVDNNGNTVWEEALRECTVTNEEKSASSGDALEVSIEGIGVYFNRDL